MLEKDRLRARVAVDQDLPRIAGGVNSVSDLLRVCVDLRFAALIDSCGLRYGKVLDFFYFGSSRVNTHSLPS